MESDSSHELLWLVCPAKRCCSIRTVRPTSGDVWRIAATLQVAPETFLRAIPAEPADEGFVLAQGGQPMQLALARRAAKGRQATCVFLMQIGDDVARCGLGDLRPLSCRAFPGAGANGILRIDDPGCTCRTWSLADLDRSAVATLLHQEAGEREIDRLIMHEWNTQVVATARSGLSLHDFCAFLLHTYPKHMALPPSRGNE